MYMKYVQMKNVLKHKFPMFKDLMTKNKSVGFDVILPGVTSSLFINKLENLKLEDNSNQNLNPKIKNKNKDNKKDKLVMVDNDSECDEKDHITKIPISLIAKQLFSDLNVINGFRSLYTKYIDPSNASFMINISSQNRQNLINLLDSRHYQRLHQTRRKVPSVRALIRMVSHGHSAKSVELNKQIQGASVETGDATGGQSETTIEIDSTQEQQQQQQQTKKRKNMGKDYSLVNEQYERHKYKNRTNAMEWLLKTLTIDMDLAAKEISVLMNDSFTRFKGQYK